MQAESILVVEDEVLVARDIKARLIRMGYNVVDTVTRGKDAIDRALELKPNLILMDIHLADDIDGVDAAVEIRKQLDVPVIFCTAYSNEETLERAKVSTPYGYVLKPFDNRELEINIEIALYKHRAEKELSHTRRRLDATLSNIGDGVIVSDNQGNICIANTMAEKITGNVEHKIGSMLLQDFLPLSAFEKGETTFDMRVLTHESSVTNLRQKLHYGNEKEVPIELSMNIVETNEDELVVITFRDITRQVQYEEHIRHSAFYDDLTQLPNRSLFMNRLESSVNRRKRGVKDLFAVAFFDLDGFGSINEGLGHESGDMVLTEVAARIAITVRPDDTISRFSGDIFAVLLDPVDSVEGAITACQRIQQALEVPLLLDSVSHNVTASAGIVLCQDLYGNAEEMVRDAETALHRAKTDAKGSYVIFDSLMYKNALRFIERKASMQTAVQNGAFEVYYQPIVNVSDEKLASMEALLRWPHPEEGFISPAEFIPIAEQTGLILPLGEFVLRSVCKQIKSWGKAGFNGFRVAVNLSAKQFENNIPDLVGGILRDVGVSADSLALEVTEGVAMKNVDQNIRMLEELRALGVSISIDDFGTGYSSLAYLKRFPINILKIDRSFIQDITENEDDREITKAIIAMGQNLGLKVLAEGVETDSQVKMLRESGCDYIQGYYYCRPLPAHQLVPYLKEHSLV